jgi:hypothetical protein
MTYADFNQTREAAPPNFNEHQLMCNNACRFSATLILKRTHKYKNVNSSVPSPGQFIVAKYSKLGQVHPNGFNPNPDTIRLASPSSITPSSSQLREQSRCKR